MAQLSPWPDKALAKGWKLPARRLGLDASTRLRGLLRQIMVPPAFLTDSAGVEDALCPWELPISQRKSTSLDTLKESVKSCLHIKQAQEPIAQTLQLQGHTIFHRTPSPRPGIGHDEAMTRRSDIRPNGGRCNHPGRGQVQHRQRHR